MACGARALNGRNYTILGRNRYPCAPQTCIEEAARGGGLARRLPPGRFGLERADDRSDALVAVGPVGGADLPAERSGPSHAREVRGHVTNGAVDALSRPASRDPAEPEVANGVLARRPVRVAS